MELTTEKIQDEANSRQLEGVEPHSFYAGAMWAKKQIEKQESKVETLVIPDVVASDFINVLKFAINQGYPMPSNEAIGEMLLKMIKH